MNDQYNPRRMTELDKRDTLSKGEIRKCGQGSTDSVSAQVPAKTKTQLRGQVNQPVKTRQCYGLRFGM